MKDKHKGENPDSKNARPNRGRVIDEEPELFGDDELPRLPDKQRIAKSLCSTNSSFSSGLNLSMFQDMFQQQYELYRKEKIERLDRETAARVELINSQKVAEDLSVVVPFFPRLTDLRLFHLSAIMSTISPPTTDEAS
ncbi:hypothetical protein Tco_0948013 [Tanacetum coccineum]